MLVSPPEDEAGSEGAVGARDGVGVVAGRGSYRAWSALFALLRPSLDALEPSESRTQRKILGAELSLQILNVVLGQPAIVITLEDSNLTLKIMRTGPADALTNVKHDVKIEGDEEKALDEVEVVTPANVDMAPTDDQDDALMEEPQTLVTMRLPTHLVTQHSPQAKKILTQWRPRGERRLMLWEKFWTSQTR